MYVCAAPFAKKPHKSGQIHACLQGVSSLWELYPAGKSKEISISEYRYQKYTSAGLGILFLYIS